MQHDATAIKYWPKLYSDFPNFQFALLDEDKLVAVGNSTPLHWDLPFNELPDEGLDWAMEKASNDFAKRRTPNVLVGLQILINPDYRGGGISFQMANIMKEIARMNSCSHLALPVRPTQKWIYPLIPMKDYITWKREDGLAFDPWIRVHLKMGGEIVGICNNSMDISGSVSEWESWTGMKFPGSGSYCIDQALGPVAIDLEKKHGQYLEPNVWIVHSIE